MSKDDYPRYLAESKKAATLLHDPQRMAIVSSGEKGWARGGARAMFSAILKQQHTLYAGGKEPAYNLAQMEALGTKSRRSAICRRPMQNAIRKFLRLRIDATMSSLHGDPRFPELLAKVGLPALP